jgi:hypothetical protein
MKNGPTGFPLKIYKICPKHYKLTLTPKDAPEEVLSVWEWGESLGFFFVFLGILLYYLRTFFISWWLLRIFWVELPWTVFVLIRGILVFFEVILIL